MLWHVPCLPRRRCAAAWACTLYRVACTVLRSGIATPLNFEGRSGRIAVPACELGNWYFGDVKRYCAPRLSKRLEPRMWVYGLCPAHTATLHVQRGLFAPARPARLSASGRSPQRIPAPGSMLGAQRRGGLFITSPSLAGAPCPTRAPPSSSPTAAANRRWSSGAR